MTTDSKNLETLAIKIAYYIVKEINNSSNKSKLKNLVDKALGVLSNDGVYAYYVYIISQNKKEVEEIFLDKLEVLFELLGIKAKKEDIEDKQLYFQKLSEDLHKLLLFKQILEKILIYARYHLRAIEG
ncbi:MAG: hypothetical protein N2Z81_04165 [Hydrogenothermaceae bacterium]|nr:hypothetical protein [Hydrogenothermaceae bacterium]